MITIPRIEYERMQTLISVMETKIKELQDEISLLKGGKDSKTSSTAPSQDIGRSNKISLRVSNGRKPGGQPGHIGYTLSMSQTPDETIEYRPSVCSVCGQDLQNVKSRSYIRRQIVDIPPVSPIYTEHQAHMRICPFCQTENRSVLPEHVQAQAPAPIQYGANIKAQIAYLSVFQSLPYHRICKLFNDFYGLCISQGSIDTILENMAQKSTSAYQTIKERILESKVIGADETGCRVNGKKHWFHVWQTKTLTFIVSFASRGYSVIEKYFSDGFPFSVYVSDCWASQLKVPAMVRQLCMAHLLRELTNFARNLNSQWSAQMKQLFLKAIELKKNMTTDDYLTLSSEVVELNEELDKLLKVDFTKFHIKEQALFKRLLKHRQSIFTFLTNPDVPPDNNASERAIRNVKVKTKVSGQFRNADGKGADRYAKIRSVIDTTIKNGQDVYAALVAMANCNIVTIPE